MWFFHHSLHSAFVFFIPFFTSSSLSVPLFVSLLPFHLPDSLPTVRWTVRSHRLSRKQGLKFKAAGVDLAGGKGTQRKTRPLCKPIQILYKINGILI